MVAGRNQSPIIQRRLDEIANQVSKVHMTHMKPKERNKKLKELLDEAEGVLLHGYGRKLRR